MALLCGNVSDKRMPISKHRALALACACIVAACDTQATPSYQGESLFKLKGKVTIEDQTLGELVPALAFENPLKGRFDIMDADVRGTFPNNFSLSLYTAPPRDALIPGPKGEPDYAIGFITALSEEHAPFIYSVVSEEHNDQECDAQHCYHEYKGCSVNDTVCYREKQQCDLNGQHCMVIETSGDATIQREGHKSFAGLSANYCVLYVADDVPAHSVISTRIADGKALAAGYHLLNVLEPSHTKPRPYEECAETALMHGACLVYDRLHGTNYAEDDDPYGSCEHELEPACIEGNHAAELEFDALYRVQEIEHGCLLGPKLYALVAHSEDTPVTIHIAPDIDPFQSPDGADK